MIIPMNRSEQSANEPLEAGLYIVATPIGNLADLTPRAGDVLKRADILAVEDSRVTAKLLQHVGIKRPMTTYHDHNADAVRPGLVDAMTSRSVALISDAGTPLISDPGYKLVRDARAAGRNIITIPGPCAAIAALTLSGLATDRFLFLGFLPSKAQARQAAIEDIAGVRASLILYESAPRLAACLSALHERLGDRQAAVVREISKRFEETRTGTLSSLAARYMDAPPRGEIVIVVAPPEPSADPTSSEIDEALADAMVRVSLSEAVAEVSKKLHLNRKRLYSRALELKG